MTGAVASATGGKRSGKWQEEPLALVERGREMCVFGPIPLAVGCMGRETVEPLRACQFRVTDRFSFFSLSFCSFCRHAWWSSVRTCSAREGGKGSEEAIEFVRLWDFELAMEEGQA